MVSAEGCVSECMWWRHMPFLMGKAMGPGIVSAEGCMSERVWCRQMFVMGKAGGPGIVSAEGCESERVWWVAAHVPSNGECQGARNCVS